MIMLLFSVCCVHISLMFCCLYICLLGITRHKAKSTAYSKSTAVDLDFHIHISGFVLPNPHMWIPNPRTSQIHAPQTHGQSIVKEVEVMFDYYRKLHSNLIKLF